MADYVSNGQQPIRMRSEDTTWKERRLQQICESFLKLNFADVGAMRDFVLDTKVQYAIL